MSHVEKWNLKDTFFLKKCHRVNAGKFRQLNLVGDEPEWVNEIRTIILFMK